MSVPIPKGFLLTGVHCRIKADPRSPDLALIMSEAPAAAAGVYTRNLVRAAPVELDRSRTPSDRIRAVVVNAGNANACTGARGMDDARKMAELAAAVCGAAPDEALVMSTGIIGHYLPMDKIEQGIAAAAVKLGSKPTDLAAAARAIMTTDLVPKVAGRTLELAGRTVQIMGMAKGSGMIAPNMATMLGLVLTDAPLSPEAAQAMLRDAADVSFNCVSVDGHVSTNDTLLLLANGEAGGPAPTDADRAVFQKALDDVCVELARAIADDGEGATHLVTIDVAGCADRESARRIARSIADSPLVKTAIAGADPNWGRIVSAAGYAGVAFDPEAVGLKLNGFTLYDRGAPCDFEAQCVAESIRSNRETHVELNVGNGPGRTRFWTCDLTAEYVRINADYHT
ncbi:MAG: bifunctional glutamate N-acetyltransferase/amino-acid acetyltransferase ArgJ [Pirellulales bacterium]|nr:bifunctional glutamate N-acetyltransferase/amino-acid acetyltransferase ArgJ [Pirellulales bacterium]